MGHFFPFSSHSDGESSFFESLKQPELTAMECIISLRGAGTEQYPENLEPCRSPASTGSSHGCSCTGGVWLCELQLWPGHKGSPPAAGHSLQPGGSQPLLDLSPSKAPGMTAQECWSLLKTMVPFQNKDDSDGKLPRQEAHTAITQ